MAGDRRARRAETAMRINAAAEALAGGATVAEAVRVLADRFGVSQRQARRYVDRAAADGPVVVPAATSTFTVKLPVALAARVREHAAGSGRTISSVVAQALEEFLRRRGRERRRG